ncbi:MAG TPA: RluA family pseudouridine synthase [Vicinamibacterales bacterium]|jgi:23S rRNA pseudouridine1911/1915/1917 synthase|nr:RluA family pseudouridine synthase [Vicinamibacterales bacterium]
MKTILSDRGDAGCRIDMVVCRHLAGDQATSRTRAQAWIEEGLVSVNGAPVTRASQRVAAGDRIAVALPAAAPRRMMEAEQMPLRVLYEDDVLIAIDKPAGAIVHPTFGHATGTIMNALLWRAREWPGGRTPALVGRLDKDTTGVLLASKDPTMHGTLQRATAAGAGVKDYLALVYGRVPARGHIDLPLGPDPSDRRRTQAGIGAPSLTRFTRLARARVPQTEVSLLRCSLGSGRRHQIRAHLAARGWPIVGDPVYGEPRWKNVLDAQVASALGEFPRQALHAERLAFRHPVTGAPVIISSRMPDDLAALLATLRIAIPGK